MMNKKIVTYFLCLCITLGWVNPSAAVNKPESAFFTAGIDLTGSFKKPSAKIHYKIQGTGGDESIRSIPFNDTEAMLLFEEDVTRTFAAQSMFEKQAYFPNNVVVSLQLTGENPQKGVTNTLNGNAVIPYTEVRSPGIAYYISAEDSKTRQLYLVGLSVLNVVPAQDDWKSIPVSNTLSADLTPSGGALVFPDTNPLDGAVQLLFSPGAVDQNVEISVTMVNGFSAASGGSGPMVEYCLEPAGFSPKKGFRAKLLYPDTDNDGVVDGTNTPETDLTVGWHDGFEWRPMSGNVDTIDNLITVEMGHFSRFGIFSAAALPKNQYRPKSKIITPALADGINDFAQFDNLAGRTDVSIKLFDVTGRKIRTVQSPYIWDGRDDDGDIVESGVYIYQFEVDGTMISGTIAVAK